MNQPAKRCRFSTTTSSSTLNEFVCITIMFLFVDDDCRSFILFVVVVGCNYAKIETSAKRVCMYGNDLDDFCVRS